jgi:hypothetical protein
MVKPPFDVRHALSLLFLVLAACAGRPVAQAFVLPPGIAAGASTYAISPPSDEAGQAALPFVDRQLRRQGFQPSPSPDLLVTIAVTERGRNVGAFSPDACDPSRWTQRAGKKWLAGGGRAMGLQIVFLDARTRLPVYRSSASMRTAGGSVENHVEALAAAALRGDPRRARSCSIAS